MRHPVCIEEHYHLIREYLPLAKKLAHQYWFNGDDPESVAVEALVRAAAVYEPTKGEFASLARRCITNALKQSLAWNHRDDTTVKFSQLEQGRETKNADPVRAYRWYTHAQTLGGRSLATSPRSDMLIISYADAPKQFARFLSMLTDEEKAIVALRLRGRKSAEIFTALRISQPTYSRRLKHMQTCFTEAFA